MNENTSVNRDYR